MFSQERGGASGDPSARASPDPSGRRWQSRTADIGGRGGIVSLIMIMKLVSVCAAANGLRRRREGWGCAAAADAICSGDARQWRSESTVESKSK